MKNTLNTYKFINIFLLESFDKKSDSHRIVQNTGSCELGALNMGVWVKKKGFKYRIDKRPICMGGDQVHVVDTRSKKEYAYRSNGERSERGKYKEVATKSVRELVKEVFNLPDDSVIGILPFYPVCGSEKSIPYIFLVSISQGGGEIAPLSAISKLGNDETFEEKKGVRVLIHLIH